MLLGVDPARFADLAAAVLRPRPPPTVGIDHLHASTVSVAEHVAILRERLAELGEATFAALTVDCEEPLEVIARFMARAGAVPGGHDRRWTNRSASAS